MRFVHNPSLYLFICVLIVRLNAESIDIIDESEECVLMVSPITDIFYEDEPPTIYLAVGGCPLAQEGAACEAKVCAVSTPSRLHCRLSKPSTAVHFIPTSRLNITAADQRGRTDPTSPVSLPTSSPCNGSGEIRTANNCETCETPPPSRPPFALALSPTPRRRAD